ncbi:MAG TPA: acyltransferase [Pseudomonadales bacterium]
MWQRYRKHLDPRADWRDICTPAANRIPVLDGVRALGILLVVGLHCVFGVARILQAGDRDTFIAELPHTLDMLWQARGSDTIFILCGLLVALMLFKELDRTGGIDIRGFYRKRLMRIIPMYWFGILLFLAFEPKRVTSLWSNLLFLSNIVPDQQNIIPVGWSMNIQVQFYLFLPFIVLGLAKSRHPLQWLFCALILAVMLRYVAVMLHPPLQQLPFYILFDSRDYSRLYADTLYYNLHTRIGPFLMGIAVAWIWRYRPERIVRYLSNPFINSALLLTAIICILIAARIGIHNPADAFYHPFDTTRNLLYLVFNKYQYSLGTSLIILCALFPAGLSQAVSRALSLRVWHPFAELIYGLYLFHFIGIAIAGVVVFGTLDRSQISTASIGTIAAIFGVAIVLSLALAAIVYVLIEKPFIRMEKAAR